LGLLAAGCLISTALQAEPLGCLIQPYQEADVGTQVVGLIDHVLVERGDFVKKGQPLVELRSDVERANVTVARSKAEASAELQAAASNHEFLQKKKVRTQDLYQKNFVSQQVKDQAITEAEVAEMKLRQAREAQRQAQQELALAQAQLSQRTIRSPMSGVVVERYLSEGERVEEKPVMKVATIDPLRVEVIVPATYFNRIKQGMSASVKPEVAEAEARAAKVIIVDRVIDAASNSFRVRLELPNPNNGLPPGVRCKLEFDASGPTAEAAPPKPAERAAAESTQPKPSVRPTADNAQPKPAVRNPGESAPPKPPARPSVAAAAAAPVK
jgi:RND family efflux transporter MFP subunit